MSYFEQVQCRSHLHGCVISDPFQYESYVLFLPLTKNTAWHSVIFHSSCIFRLCYTFFIHPSPEGKEMRWQGCAFWIAMGEKLRIIHPLHNSGIERGLTQSRGKYYNIMLRYQTPDRWRQYLSSRSSICGWRQTSSGIVSYDCYRST
jgi:hypothetical protein